MAHDSPAPPSSFPALSPEESRWSVADCLTKLADAADHLLRDHDCDAHGWEQVGSARDAARRHAARLSSVPEQTGRECERCKQPMSAFEYDGETRNNPEWQRIANDAGEASKALRAIVHSAPPAASEGGMEEPFPYLARQLEAQDITATKPLAQYGVRRCRGHWHVTSFGEDIIDEPNFSTCDAALDRANLLNRNASALPDPRVHDRLCAAAPSTPAPIPESLNGE